MTLTIWTLRTLLSKPILSPSGQLHQQLQTRARTTSPIRYVTRFCPLQSTSWLTPG